jgi:hypothetical protein
MMMFSLIKLVSVICLLEQYNNTKMKNNQHALLRTSPFF